MKITALFATALMAHASLATGAYAQEAPHYVPLPANDTLGPGKPLMKGLSGPKELAQLIQASLNKDPSGNTLLDSERCRLNGSCATPNIYFVAINKWHPRSGLTKVSDLPQYISGLMNIIDHGGEYYSARLVNGILDLDSGFHRKLAEGEYAWQDTQTGEVILLENCGNVAMLVPAEPIVVEAPCIKVSYTPPFGTYTTTTVRYDVYGPHALSGKCLRVEQSGVGKTDLADNCPSHTCSFANTEAFIIRRDHAVVNWHKIGSYVPVQAGTDAIYLPADAKDGFTVSICIDVRGPDGQIHHVPVVNKFLHQTDGGHEFTMVPFPYDVSPAS